MILRKVGWDEDFMEVLMQGWNWQQAAYIAWASTPVQLRNPRSIVGFCEMTGMGRSTLYDWLKQNTAVAGVIRNRIVKPIADKSRDIVDAMIETAVVPDPKNFQDRKMALEILQIYVPGKALFEDMRKKGEVDLSKRSDAELEEIISIEAQTHRADAHRADESRADEKRSSA